MSAGAVVAPPRVSRAATAHNVAALAARAWKVSVLGADLVPHRGPIILASHHTAFLDGLLLASASPRPVHVLASAELFAPPWDRMLRGTGQIALDHEKPDRAALRTAAALLSSGGAVGAFPEPSRGAGEVRHVRHELPYLAAATGALVVPVAILGSRPAGGGRDALPRLRTPIDVVFGEPVDIRVDGDPRRRAVLARSGERLRQLLSDHVRAACARTGRTLPDHLPHPSHQTRSDS
jgi:1-acyl-sn-glycerol-3-phosphate acyltransferase